LSRADELGEKHEIAGGNEKQVLASDAGGGVGVLAVPLAAQPAAVWGICGYQRWISPYLGDCACRRAGAGVSCSEFAKRRIQSEGLWRALGELPGQFRRCHEAARATGLRREAASGAEVCCMCSYLGCCHDWSEDLE
jgi:putative component of membrane protein insertase Oxa1/YidC/SpoIIIJ protein YidD